MREEREPFDDSTEVGMMAPFELVTVSDALGDNITAALEGFAKGHSARSVTRYHDVPVWFVWIEEDEIIRRVQVAPSRFFPESPRASSHTELRLIPSVLRVADNRVVARQAPERLAILAIALKERQQELPEGFIAELDKAWSVAQKMATP